MLYYIFHYAFFVDIFFIIASSIAGYFTYKMMANRKFRRDGKYITYAEAYDSETPGRFFLENRTSYYYACLVLDISWSLFIITALMWGLTI